MKLTDALKEFVIRTVRETGTVNLPTANEYLAVWNSTESLDANLSIVTLQGGSVARFVPKLAHVTGLASGDVVVVRGGGAAPMYISGKLIGNISLAATTGDLVPPSGVGTLSAGTATTTTVPLSWSTATDNVGISGYNVFVNNAFRAKVSGTSYTVTGLAAGTSYTFGVQAQDLAGNVGTMSTVVKSTAASGGGTPTSHTLTRRATWSRSFNYQGHNEYDSWFGTACYQGEYAGANQRSMIGFDYASIQAELAGATVTGCWIDLTYAHWFSNSGGIAVIGTHGMATPPSTWSGNDDRVRVANWRRGQRKSVSLNAGIGREFQTGFTRGIVLGPGPTSNTAYYGYAYGAGSKSNTPLLTISYLK